jgi:hypothetical protein
MKREQLQAGMRGSSKSAIVYVPGTGNVDSAKSFVAAANTWWIVKEMPLDP